MDILDRLEKEHKEVSDLMSKACETSDDAAKTRKDLLSRIETKLVEHAKAEEAVFYPAFKKRADHGDLKAHAEAWQEHRAIEKQVLPDLKKADPGSREFAGRMKVFKEYVEHHVKEEEGTMFAAFRKLYDEKERKEIDKQYQEWKKNNDPTSKSASKSKKKK